MIEKFTSGLLARHYPLAILSLVSLFYYIDRYIIYILIEPIRTELNLTDGQMGMITGLAFAIAYTVLVLPVGILTDRVNRVRFLALFVTIWCLFTAFSGMARSYLEMIFLRAGVAAGEAGGSIPGQALVSDFYPPETRGRAFSVYFSTAHLGKFLAFAGAGYLGELVGWRMTFAIVGSLGLFLGPLLLFTLREPKRGAADGNDGMDVLPAPPKRIAISSLLKRRGYVLLVAGYAFAGMAIFSMISWLPAFFMRRFDLATGDAGLLISVATVLPSLVGMAVGGILSDRLFRTRVSWIAHIPAIVLILACPALVMQVYASSLALTIMVGLIPAIAMGVYAPPLISAIHLTAGARMRGTATAVVLVALMLVGQGLGPALSGLVSEAFSIYNTPDQPYLSLRYSLSCISALFIVGGVLLFFAGPRISRDLETAKKFDRGESPAMVPQVS